MLGHLITLCLTLWGAIRFFSKATASFYNLISNWGFQFLYILTNTCCFPFFYYSYLVIIKRCLILVLICISLMADDIEPLFMCLLTTHIFSLEKNLSRLYPHFSIGLFFFLLLSCNHFLYVPDTSPLEDTWFAKIFCHYLGCLLT